MSLSAYLSFQSWHGFGSTYDDPLATCVGFFRPVLVNFPVLLCFLDLHHFKLSLFGLLCIFLFGVTLGTLFIVSCQLEDSHPQPCICQLPPEWKIGLSGAFSPVQARRSPPPATFAFEWLLQCWFQWLTVNASRAAALQPFSSSLNCCSLATLTSRIFSWNKFQDIFESFVNCFQLMFQALRLVVWSFILIFISWGEDHAVCPCQLLYLSSLLVLNFHLADISLLWSIPAIVGVWGDFQPIIQQNGLYIISWCCQIRVWTTNRASNCTSIKPIKWCTCWVTTDTRVNFV